MAKDTKFVGLDVHKETISVAVATREGGVESLGTIPHEEAAIRRLIKQLGPPSRLFVVYEAGPCGYALYRFLQGLKAACEVIAPSLVPQKPGDRVKTDRRDAMKLARGACNDELTAVAIPSVEQEAFRDLVRCREIALTEVQRSRHRLQKLLLRQNARPPAKMRSWGADYRVWLKTVRFQQAALQLVLEDARAEVDHQEDRLKRMDVLLDAHVQKLDALSQKKIVALQALRGVKTVVAATWVAEIGDASRFDHPRKLMSYVGIVPSEYSSGNTRRRGAITKCGNAHVRRVVVEAAWLYRMAPRPGRELRARRAKVPPEVQAIAEKAEKRLHARFARLVFKNKPNPKAVTAVARELLGFIWAICRQVEQQHERLGAKTKAA